MSSCIIVPGDIRLTHQTVRRGARPTTDTIPGQRLEAATIDWPVPNLRCRKNLADVLRRVRQDRTAERLNWSSRFALRLRRRRDREGVPAGGPDTLQARHALSGAL